MTDYKFDESGELSSEEFDRMTEIFHMRMAQTEEHTLKWHLAFLVMLAEAADLIDEEGFEASLPRLSKAMVVFTESVIKHRDLLVQTAELQRVYTAILDQQVRDEANQAQQDLAKTLEEWKGMTDGKDQG